MHLLEMCHALAADGLRPHRNRVDSMNFDWASPETPEVNPDKAVLYIHADPKYFLCSCPLSLGLTPSEAEFQTSRAQRWGCRSCMAGLLTALHCYGFPGASVYQNFLSI